MNTMGSIVSFGDIMFEYILNVPYLPKENQTQIIDEATVSPGGPAVNIAWYLSRAGWDTRLVGICGKFDKDLLFETLSEATIDPSGIMFQDGRSDYIFNLITDNTFHSIYVRSKIDQLYLSSIAEECTAHNHLILTGSRHRNIRKTGIKIANAFNGDSIVFIPSYALDDYSKDDLIPLFKRADIIALNQNEANAVCNLFKLGNFDELYGYIGKLLIITLGEDGAVVYKGRKTIKIESFAENVINTIGSGDALLSGFLDHYYRGHKINDSIVYGSVVAAFCTESPNVRVSISDNEIDARFEKVASAFKQQTSRDRG
jgi:sugar/nucleoside kinase (ribokinase family)